MLYELELTADLWLRWTRYQQDNKAWSGKFNELVVRLLEQHFSEADTIQQSVEAQDRRRGHE
ncbi:MAG: hypothetical protein ACRCZI_15760 [Cetobacterium sp.]